VLGGWLLFALAGLAFYKTTEESGFHRVGELHPLLGFAHLTVQLIAIFASLGVLAAVAPFAYRALNRSRENREARAAAILAAASVGLLFLATVGIVLLAAAPGPAPRGVSFGALFAWTLIAVAAGIGCLVAARRGLFAISIRRPDLRVLVALGSMVAAAMAAMTVATGIYLIGLVLDAPTAGGQANGPLGLVSVTASVTLQLTVMVVATALAGVSSVRGWRALNGSPAA
jgi:hypothetical protein